MEKSSDINKQLNKLLQGFVKPRGTRRSGFSRMKGNNKLRTVESRVRFAYGLMLVAIFEVSLSAFPLATAPANRFSLLILAFITFLIGGLKLDRINHADVDRGDNDEPHDASTSAPTPLRPRK